MGMETRVEGDAQPEQPRTAAGTCGHSRTLSTTATTTVVGFCNRELGHVGWHRHGKVEWLTFPAAGGSNGE